MDRKSTVTRNWGLPARSQEKGSNGRMIGPGQNLFRGSPTVSSHQTTCLEKGIGDGCGRSVRVGVRFLGRQKGNQHSHLGRWRKYDGEASAADRAWLVGTRHLWRLPTRAVVDEEPAVPPIAERARLLYDRAPVQCTAAPGHWLRGAQAAERRPWRSQDISEGEQARARD